MSETLSIPSLIFVLAISFIFLRYILPLVSGGGVPVAQTQPGSSGTRARPLNLAHVDQVAQMFPQLDRRAIAWNLERNGGNVGATTERMLTTGALETPPPFYQPPNLSATSTPSASNTTAQAPVSRKQQDLISRYNLSKRVDEDGLEEEETEAPPAPGKGKSTGWASTKNERAALLAKRRDDMILQARRKMQEKQRREEKGKGKAVD